jgi:hypothetical protein
MVIPLGNSSDSYTGPPSVAGFASRLRVAIGFVVFVACHAFALSGASAATKDGSDLGRALVGDERLKALEMLTAQMKGNYERIQTLEGSYRFDDRFRFSGFWEISKGIATFSLDTTSRKYHVFYAPNTPVRFIDVATGKESRWRTNGDSIHWIFTPEHALKFDVGNGMGRLKEFPPVASVPPTGGRIVYKETPKTERRNTRVLDVRDFYTNGSRPFWEWIGLYASTLRGERSDEERALVEHGLHVYVSEGPTLMYVVRSTYYSDGNQITTVCDGSAAFNVVSYERVNAEGEPTHTRKIRFREVEGIYLPEFVGLYDYDENAAPARMRMKREFELESLKVNHPIAARTFEVEALGVAYGERMLDKITNQLMVNDGDQGFVPAEKFVMDSSRLPAGHPMARSEAIPKSD